MKRHPALIPLSQDHQKGLLLAQLLKKNAPEYKGLPSDIIGKINFAKDMYKNELDNHFEDEEKLLFPYLKGKDKELDNLIAEILDEHIFLKEKILGLTENTEIIDQLDEIGNVLDQHIRKEERILFEKAQSILDEQELNLIASKFDERRPNSKACIIK